MCIFTFSHICGLHVSDFPDPEYKVVASYAKQHCSYKSVAKKKTFACTSYVEFSCNYWKINDNYIR